MEEYLTTDELCDRIKYQRQTIYNLIHRRVLLPGKHFFKPTPKKILFKWSEIQAWIGDNSCVPDGSGIASEAGAIDHPLAQVAAIVPKNKPANLIRI